MGATALLYLFCGIRNLWACDKVAQFSGLRLKDVFSRWLDGIDPHATYSGLYLKAVERLETGLLQFGAAVTIAVMTVGLVLVVNRNRRIIDYIESKEQGA